MYKFRGPFKKLNHLIVAEKMVVKLFQKSFKHLIKNCITFSTDAKPTQTVWCKFTYSFRVFLFLLKKTFHNLETA